VQGVEDGHRVRQLVADGVRIPAERVERGVLHPGGEAGLLGGQQGRVGVPGPQAGVAQPIARVLRARQCTSRPPNPGWEVTVAWQCYQPLRSIYHQNTPTAGRRLAEQVIASLPTGPIGEVARLGRTMRAWRAQVLAYFDTGGVSNGGTEAINLIIEKTKDIVSIFAYAWTNARRIPETTVGRVHRSSSRPGQGHLSSEALQTPGPLISRVAARAVPPRPCRWTGITACSSVLLCVQWQVKDRFAHGNQGSHNTKEKDEASKGEGHLPRMRCLRDVCPSASTGRDLSVFELHTCLYGSRVD
jgi:hypothetical protein